MAAKSKKINLAKEQLEDGIELYFKGRYASALTLLGAAEKYSVAYYWKRKIIRQLTMIGVLQ